MGSRAECFRASSDWTEAERHGTTMKKIPGEHMLSAIPARLS
jgi:hypothetical protein